MKSTRHFVFDAVAVMMMLSPSFCQDQSATGQSTPAVSGTGTAGKIPIWKTGTTLGNSVLVQSGGNVGIGTSSAPAAKLEVSGDAQVDGNFTLSGSILNGIGQLLWAPTNGSGNFSIGVDALPSTTTGAQNTAVGTQALQMNSSGYENTAIGYEALVSNSIGNSNTAIGLDALHANTTGNDNTATGLSALYSNTTGSDNTATGMNALQLNNGGGNTATGWYAMFRNTTGSSNTAIGTSALSSNTVGQYITAIGSNVLSSNTTGENNIAIGWSAGVNITTTSNNIHIGNQGVVTDSGVIRLGCVTNCAGSYPAQTSAYVAGIYGSMAGLAGVPVVVDSNGQLGTISSSRRYKEDIQDMGDSSDGLMKLRPVTFRYKKAYDDGSKPVQFGLIAEEVAEVYPDLVVRSADGQVESIRYQLLDPMLLNELQKQHATITAQEQQIRTLEERLARIEAVMGTAAASASAR